MACLVRVEGAVVTKVTPSTKKPGTSYVDMVSRGGDQLNVSSSTVSPQEWQNLIAVPTDMELTMRFSTYNNNQRLEVVAVKALAKKAG